VLAPSHFEFCETIADGVQIQVGQPLMRKKVRPQRITEPPRR
jgi:hypothetical protein